MLPSAGNCRTDHGGRKVASSPGKETVEPSSKLSNDNTQGSMVQLSNSVFCSTCTERRCSLEPLEGYVKSEISRTTKPRLVEPSQLTCKSIRLAVAGRIPLAWKYSSCELLSCTREPAARVCSPSVVSKSWQRLAVPPGGTGVILRMLARTFAKYSKPPDSGIDCHKTADPPYSGPSERGNMTSLPFCQCMGSLWSGVLTR